MNKSKQLTQLFMETGKAHHHAYIETDGLDPEWALWYANYLQVKLNELLGTELVQSHIVYELIRLEKKMADSDTTAHWTQYYAEDLVKAYA